MDQARPDGGGALPIVNLVHGYSHLLLVNAPPVLLMQESVRAPGFNAVIVVSSWPTILFVMSEGAHVRERQRTGRRSLPMNTGNFGEYGWSGIAMAAAAVIFFAYIGFDAVSTPRRRRDPQRDMPRGILGSPAVRTIPGVAAPRSWVPGPA